MSDFEAAAAAASALLGGAGDEAGDEPEQTGAAAEGDEPTQEAALEAPSFAVELPEDLAEELEAPEFTVTEDELEDLDDLDADPAVLARLKEAEKRAAYYERQNQEKARAKAREEAEKFFPLSKPFLDKIEATSRRGFLREAKAYHESVLPIVEQHVKPLIEKANETIEAEREKARQEARAEAEKAWGRIPGGGGTAPGDAPREQVERARRKGDLADTLKAMMFPKGG